MVYAVDILYNVMKKISGAEPVLFQRDGNLYIASEAGFGLAAYGLYTSSRPEWDPKTNKQLGAPEILGSQDLIKEVKKEKYGRNTLVYLPGEERRIKPICFGSDTRNFSLEEITKAARELATLPDDGKIRLVSHDSSHHSHKYGYATDGIDVWLDQGRVMDRQRYLELMREKEEQMLKTIQSIPGENRKALSNYYNGPDFYVKFPDCVIITPHIWVNFPRPGRYFNSWGQHTEFDTESPKSILSYGPPATLHENPFKLVVVTNSHCFEGLCAADIDTAKTASFSRAELELKALLSEGKHIDTFLEMWNRSHNAACAAEIQDWKESTERLRQKSRKRDQESASA